MKMITIETKGKVDGRTTVPILLDQEVIHLFLTRWFINPQLFPRQLIQTHDQAFVCKCVFTKIWFYEDEV